MENIQYDRTRNYSPDTSSEWRQTLGPTQCIEERYKKNKRGNTSTLFRVGYDWINPNSDLIMCEYRRPIKES